MLHSPSQLHALVTRTLLRAKYFFYLFQEELCLIWHISNLEIV